jgi:fatty acid desaturase
MLRGDASPSMQLLKTDDQSKRDTESKRFVTFIIRLALFELIANLGFVIAIRTSQMGLMIPFFCAAWLGMALTPVEMVSEDGFGS